MDVYTQLWYISDNFTLAASDLISKIAPIEDKEALVKLMAACATSTLFFVNQGGLLSTLGSHMIDLQYHLELGDGNQDDVVVLGLIESVHILATWLYVPPEVLELACQSVGSQGE